jgi:hypothetical protein
MKIKQTAKEFLKEFLEINPGKKYDDVMIEFAKHHCKKQLKAILEKAKPIHKGYGYYEVDKNSIINAYNLNNIK